MNFTRSTAIDATAEELFAWHASPGAFERLSPPWNPPVVLDRRGTGLEVGLRLTVKIAPSPVPWVTEHTACTPPSGFVDELVSGPLASWRHEHRFEDGRLTDAITFEPALGLGGGLITRQLAAAFAFRHARTALDLHRHRPYRDRPRLRVAITGASGLLGTELAGFLRTGGHEVLALSRAGAVRWDPERGEIDAAALEGVDAVVHLAGESISSRWTDERRQRILASRVEGTRLLARALAGLSRKPSVVLSGSAVGYYGDRGDELLDEGATSGSGFLAEVCRAWEQAAEPIGALGIRCVTLRTGLVLSGRGGLLASLLPLAKAGASGPIGGGQQWQPWIAIDDWVGAAHALLWDERASGPVNLVGPMPARQADLARSIGATLGRPAFVPTPAFAVRLALGRAMADELVLAGQRAVPRALERLGFSFAHPTLDRALRFELGHLTDAEAGTAGSEPDPTR
ncbi:MAG: TIGR01777 family oxidoreductase [Myxococcota bacterium]